MTDRIQFRLREPGDCERCGWGLLLAADVPLPDGGHSHPVVCMWCDGSDDPWSPVARLIRFLVLEERVVHRGNARVFAALTRAWLLASHDAAVPSDVDFRRAEPGDCARCGRRGLLTARVVEDGRDVLATLCVCDVDHPYAGPLVAFLSVHDTVDGSNGREFMMLASQWLRWSDALEVARARATGGSSRPAHAQT